MDEFVGLQGRMTLGCTTTPGEVLVTHNGMTHKFIAYSDQVIAAGTEVFIIGVLGGHSVDVRPAG